LRNRGYFISKYRSDCIINSRQQLLWPFLLHELDHFTTGLQSKEYHGHFIIDNNGSTTKLSTMIFCTMRRRHSTMSLVNLLHELDVFTTRVKTKTVPALGYSTSIIIVQHKSLRRNFIPCHHLLLVFLFFVVPEFKFLTARTRSKIRPKKSNIREISCV